MHEACQEGHTEVAKILLENAQNNFGETFINKMCRDQDDDGATPLLLGKTVEVYCFRIQVRIYLTQWL